MIKKFFLLLFIMITGLSFAASDGKFCDPKQGWGPTSELNSTVIEAFKNPAAWQCGQANDKCKISLSKVPTPYGDALHVDYDLPQKSLAGQWVFFAEPSVIDITKEGRISFWMRGEGEPNLFDFKFSDADGGQFKRTIRMAAGVSGWHKQIIDMKELVYVFGGANKTPEPPFKLDLAIANSYNTRNGGKGWIELAKLEQIGRNPHLQILMNQIGFNPGMHKMAVVQLNNSIVDVTTPLNYSILSFPDGKVIETGKTQKFKNSDLWPGQYWVIPFSRIEKSGKYVIKAELPWEGKTMVVKSYPFFIKKDVLTEELSQSQFHYIKFTRYPEHPNHSNPVPGGYIDTEFDIERWMTTTPVWAWGMARWQNLLSGEMRQGGVDPIDEIKYVARFCIGMQNPETGHVYCAEKSTRPTGYAEDDTPEQDTFDCILWDGYGPEVEGAYVVAMAEIFKSLEKKDPELAKASLNAAVKAWKYLSEQNLTGIQYLGMYLWASTRLYAVAGDAQYIETAKEIAEKLLPKQSLDYKNSQEQIFGVFYWNPDKSDFTYQYKFVHSIGIYLGLMELAEMLPDTDSLKAKIRFSMDCFCYGFLKQTAELNPFGKVGQALEPPVNGKSGMQLYYFASPRCPMTDHGFNCDIMSYGLIALRYARWTGNPEFAKIAVDQMSWVLGNNPSGFCMVSGKGTTNPHLLMTDLNKGPVLGAIPNGFVSPGDGNRPYWCTEWNSEEYWKPHNAMMLALMAELESGDPFMAGQKDGSGSMLEDLKAKIDLIQDNQNK